MSEIWFDSESEDWNQALPIGNGALGAMVYGGVSKERIQINEETMWSGGYMERINDQSKEYLQEIRNLLFQGNIEKAELLAGQSMFATNPHMRHYQTMGDVWIDFFNDCGQKVMKVDDKNIPYLHHIAPKTTSYSRQLDFANSIGNIEYVVNNKAYKREFFATNPMNCLVYHMTTNGTNTLDFDVSVTRKENKSGVGSSYCDGVEVIGDNTIRLYGKQGGNNGIAFEFLVRIIHSGGNLKTMGSHLVVNGAKTATIYITARTTFRSNNPLDWALKVLDAIEKKEYETLKNDHILDYLEYMNACQLHLDCEENENIPTNIRLEKIKQGSDDIGLINTYFDYAKYLLISSSREGGLPATLQGIWNQDFAPAWGSKYTININIQMNYWLSEKLGLGNLHMPLLEHIKRMYPHGKEVANRMYGVNGFCCHHNTDIWGDCAPQDNHVSSTIWPMGGAWLCLHIIEHYTYSNDKQFMYSYYDVLRDSVLFLLEYMIEDENGHYVTGPSSSPENAYFIPKMGSGCLCMGPTMDTAICKDLYEGFLWIAKEIKPQDPIIKDVENSLAKLSPLEIGQFGQIQEWTKDYLEVEKGHRHVSQLYTVYPSSQIRYDRDLQLVKAAKTTLSRRLENGGGHTGWSLAWIMTMYARLKEKEKVWQLFHDLLAKSTLDNLFDNHPPFQIDGNFGAANAIIEMLVQDYREKVFLLPALPEQIGTGRLEGIVLKAGCSMDLIWENQQVKEIRINGIRNGMCTLCIDEKEIKCVFEKDKSIILSI